MLYASILLLAVNDGWSAGGITENVGRTEQQLIAVNMVNGAHHSDLSHSLPDASIDTEDVTGKYSLLLYYIYLILSYDYSIIFQLFASLLWTQKSRSFVTAIIVPLWHNNFPSRKKWCVLYVSYLILSYEYCIVFVIMYRYFFDKGKKIHSQTLISYNMDS